MGIWKWFRKSSENEAVVVPDGCAVRAYVAAPMPGFHTGPSGVMCANFGRVGSPAKRLADIFGSAEEAMRAEPGTTTWFNREHYDLARAFKADDADLQSSSDSIIWIVQNGSLSGHLESPTKLAALVLRFARIAAIRSRFNAENQHVVLTDERFCNARAFAKLMGQLGFEVRKPASDGTAFVEVERPSGAFAAFTGAPYAPIPTSDAGEFQRRVVQRIEAEGQPKEQLHALEQPIEMWVDEVIRQDGSDGASDPWLVNEAMRRLLWESAEHGDEAHRAKVCDALMDENTVLLIGLRAVSGSDSKEFLATEHPTAGRMILAFTDLDAWRRANGGGDPVTVGAPDVLGVAGRGGAGVLLNSNGPDFFGLPSGSVKLLAQGKNPFAPK